MGACVGAGQQLGSARRQRPQRPLRCAARLAAPGAGEISRGAAPRFPGGGDPGLGQDDVRAAGGRRTARPARRRAGHRRGAHRAPQGAVGAGRGAARPGAGPAVLQQQPADRAGVPRRDGDLRSGRRAPHAAPGAHRAAQDAGHLRRDPSRRRRQDVGRCHPRGVRRRHPPARVDGHAVSQRRQPHPVRAVRGRTRRGAPLAGRPHLRLSRGAGRRRGPAGGLSGLLRGGTLARQRRRGARGAAGRAAVGRADRPGLAHRAGPGRGMDARGHRGRRSTAAPAACPHSRRRRHDHRLRPGRGPRLRDPADRDHV